MRMVGITVKTSDDTDTMSDAEFEQTYIAEVEREEVRIPAPSLDISDDRTIHLEMLIAYKRQVEEDLQALNAA